MARARNQPELPTPPRLGPLTVRPEVSALVTELQDLVREAGHHKPSQALLVSALLHAAPKDGRRLEMEYLVPFRQAYPDEE